MHTLQGVGGSVLRGVVVSQTADSHRSRHSEADEAEVVHQRPVVGAREVLLHGQGQDASFADLKLLALHEVATVLEVLHGIVCYVCPLARFAFPSHAGKHVRCLVDAGQHGNLGVVGIDLGGLLGRLAFQEDGGVVLLAAFAVEAVQRDLVAPGGNIQLLREVQRVGIPALEGKVGVAAATFGDGDVAGIAHRVVLPGTFAAVHPPSTSSYSRCEKLGILM